ncbi:hypothetical protein F3Y22_tig00110597pilonHSYRG00899 [Hibiscus syriacus]|uniref:DUF4220 domain-containing protein n=1 Tax=Hibiscus syriacus TaxID=106335 RepID=A0A6A3A3P6_HIBSY|nr:hypothetical protein F3Y22_tig00110597pilonHSYRG00899 [Hibiscus syriacus]
MVSNKYHEGRVFLENKTAEEAFRLVNIELQFLYDLFFTNNPLQHRYRRLSAFLRGFYILSPLYVLIAFSMQNNIGGVSKRDISSVDITITYMLLVGAIFLDIFALVLYMWSYLTMVLFGSKSGGKLYNRLVSFKLRSITIPKIARYDLFEDFPPTCWIKIFSPLINLIDNNEVVSKYRSITWMEIDSDMKELIYSGLKKELTGSLSCNAPRRMRVEELDASLRQYLEHGKDESKQMPTSSTKAIFIFYITTKWFNNEFGYEGPDDLSWRRKSNILSDYMLYLVLVHAMMMPKDFGDMTGESFIPDKKRPDCIRQVLRGRTPRFNVVPHHPFLRFMSQVFARKMFFPYPDDILVKGNEFCTQLLDYSSEIDGGVWRFLCDLWMIVLFDSARRCSWKEHAVALMNGGELFTHVSLLLAHHGSSPYIRIQDADPNHNNNIRAHTEIHNQIV